MKLKIAKLKKEQSLLEQKIENSTIEQTKKLASLEREKEALQKQLEPYSKLVDTLRTDNKNLENSQIRINAEGAKLAEYKSKFPRFTD